MNATPVETLVRDRIAREGPLSFRDVMQMALYHPEYGYYMRLRGFGADGDFITSPERHPAFGWLLGRQALEVWEAVGRPKPFKILELGAGTGALAEPLVAFVRDHVADIVYTIDELSPSLRGVQQARLTDPAFRWDGADEQAHLILANEVADALPVHRVVVRNGRLRELRVGLDGRNAFTWLDAEDARPELESYFAALHYLPPEGSVADVCLDLADWVTSVTRRLEERAVALIMDYSASPPRDSMLTYYRHTMGSDPLIRLGEQDISVHVDLRTLVRLAIADGLRAGATAQRALLFNLGFPRVQARLGGMTDRQALAQLVDADGLGGQIAAVFLIRGLPDYRPAGAVGRTDWPEPNDVPSLPPDAEERDFIDQWREAFPVAQEETRTSKAHPLPPAPSPSEGEGVRDPEA